MSKRKSAALPAKRWLFHGYLSDSPLSGEDTYLEKEQLEQMLKGVLLYPGLRVTNLRLTALPERAKKQPVKAEKAVENAGKAS